jgi:hypothetical protein
MLNTKYYEYLEEAEAIDIDNRLERIRYAEMKLVQFQKNDGSPCS